MMDWMDHYYFINQFWIIANLLCIVPFIFACLNRYRNQDLSIYLWTDHISRFLQIVTCSFYVYDTVVKYVVDGGETICQKALFIHHVSSQFTIIPLIINSYIPWWVNPIGLIHGFLVFFPNLPYLDYVYAAAFFYFQYMLYQKPFKDFRYYWVSRIAVNGVWAFVIFILIGNCTNFLPVGPD